MDLTERKKRILRAIIESYIQSAEPVGSKAIASSIGMEISSATIRNEMADLESLGLLEKPHTSAGRVPSHLGYRVFVDELMQVKPVSGKLRDSIEAMFNIRDPDPDKLLQDAAKALFVGGGDMSNVPATTLTEADLTDGSIGILDLMLKCKLAPSKKEARRLVEQGGVEANGEKVADVAQSYTAADFQGDGLMLKKGKKVFHRVQM